jgi:hypothetical protein
MPDDGRQADVQFVNVVFGTEIERRSYFRQ